MAIPEFSIYLDAPQTDMITCRPQVQYDKKVYSLYETRDVALRDLGKEAAVREVIQRYGEAYDERQKAAENDSGRNVKRGTDRYSVPL